MIGSLITGDGIGEGVRGRLFNIGSSSLRLEPSVGTANGESVVIVIEIGI
jgi:hypothetical protein